MGRRHQRVEGGLFEGEQPLRNVPVEWWWCCGCLAVTTALVLSIVAIVCVFRVPWTQDTKGGTILSKEGNVEIMEGFNLTIHENIIHSGEDIMARKLNFTPEFPLGPTGSNFIFGDQNIPYARLQAEFAVGIRLGTDSFLTPPDILFGEDGLKFLVEPLGVHVASVFIPFFGVFIPSDERIKTNITTMNTTRALQNVLSLRPTTYRYTEEWYNALGETTEEERGEDRRGFIAQEVEQILPHSVRETTMYLGGEYVDDFRDLRKEDIVTEVVGALHEIHNNRIIESAYNALMFESLQSQIDQNKEQAPWVPAFQFCLNNVSPQDKSLCICEFVDTRPCLGVSTGLCDPNHPLVQQCSIL